MPYAADIGLDVVNIAGVTCLNPEKIRFAPRTEFLQKIPKVLGVIEADVVTQALKLPITKINLSDTERLLVELAQMYSNLSVKNARLPKFTKWTGSLFKDDKQLANKVAEIGKTVQNEPIVFSTELLDILRCADTRHFASCFSASGSFADMPKRIAEETPGIAIAFINDDKGQMKGRVWVHHAVLTETGKDVAVCGSSYGNLLNSQVVQALRANGVEAYMTASPYDYPPSQQPKKAISYVGCFTEEAHHDTCTWRKPAYCF